MKENQAPEPWYGVRLIYKLTGFQRRTYEERVLIVRADSFAAAISKAEDQSKEDYESESCEYLGYAMAYHIFDEDGPCLGPGVEVFSLMRESDLDVDDYLTSFHDTGNERTGELRA